jgi:phosphoglucan,water dikinase
VRFGESCALVGDLPALGAWDAAAALPMEWTEGDVWTAEVALPPGAELEFKCLQRGGDGGAKWESGANHRAEVPADAGALEVAVEWGRGGAGGGGDHRRAERAPAAGAAPAPAGDDAALPGREWAGGETVFMRSNEHASVREQRASWDTAGLAGAALAVVEGDRGAGSWLKKLGVAKALLVDAAPGGRPGAEALAHAFVYLSWVASGAVPCVEAGGHHRPNHHAELSRAAFRSLEWVAVGGGAGGAAPLLARRLHTRLPAFAEAYTASTPLTRIRDIAHRGDIPQWLKSEIKHTIQNKLHRNAGPEDLVATEALLGRVTANPGEFPDAFVHELRLFTAELRDFFNAASLGDLLAALRPSLADDDAALALVDGFAAAKGRLDAAGAGADDNALMDALHGATSVRAALLAGLASGLRNDAPDHSLAMRQRWRLAELRAEDYAFVLLSRFVGALEARGGAAALAGASDGAWGLPLGALVLGVRQLGLSGHAQAECMAVERELAAWQKLGGLQHRPEALRLRATLQRLARVTEGYCELLLGALAGPAAALGPALGVDAQRAGVFVESEIRANVVFQLSKLATLLLKAATLVAGGSPWDVVVGGEAAGVLLEANALQPGCLDAAGGKDAVLVVRAATGDEEIAALGGNLRGVILRHEVPHLSHLGVRARQERVPFVGCEDAALLDATLGPLLGKRVALSASAEGFTIAEGGAASSSSGNGNGNDAAPAPAAVKPAPVTRVAGVEVVALEAATAATCGAKAAACGALARLASRSEAFSAPPGACLPFGCMEAALEAEGKAAELAALLRDAEAAAAAGGGAGLDALCADVAALVGGVRVPQAALQRLAGAFDPGVTLIVRSSANVEDLAGMSGAGLYESIPNVPAGDLKALNAAIAAVWASLHSRRALLARRAAGVAAGDAAMAVLVQAQAAPEVSFVLHTADPLSGDAGALVAEAAPGLGETLAAGTRGSGWRLRVDKASGKVETLAFANFSSALLVKKGGGGVAPAIVDYSAQELSWSEDARAGIGKRLAGVGALLEREFGGAQDVEGCIEAGGGVWVVQTRPQP